MDDARNELSAIASAILPPDSIAAIAAGRRQSQVAAAAAATRRYSGMNSTLLLGARNSTCDLPHPNGDGDVVLISDDQGRGVNNESKLVIPRTASVDSSLVGVRPNPPPMYDAIAMRVVAVIEPLLVELRMAVAALNAQSPRDFSIAGGDHRPPDSEAKVANQEKGTIRASANSAESSILNGIAVASSVSAISCPARMESDIMSAIAAAAGAAAAAAVHATSWRGGPEGLTTASGQAVSSQTLSMSSESRQNQEEVIAAETSANHDPWTPWQGLLLPARLRSARRASETPAVAAEFVHGKEVDGRFVAQRHQPSLWLNGRECDAQSAEVIRLDSVSLDKDEMLDIAMKSDSADSDSSSLKFANIPKQAKKDLRFRAAVTLTGTSSNRIPEASDKVVHIPNSKSECEMPAAHTATTIRLPQLRRSNLKYPPPLLVSPISLVAKAPQRALLDGDDHDGWGCAERLGSDPSCWTDEPRGWA